MPRIFHAGIDFGIDAGIQSLVLRVVCGFRLRAPPLPRPFSARVFLSKTRFRKRKRLLLEGARRRNPSANSLAAYL